VATILFDGVAYGMLLFVLACGLAVTLGLMNFVNLAHGAFAMAGGYVTVILMDRWGVPFLACLPLLEAGALDGRDYVKKGVDMALRTLGKRNPTLRRAAIDLALLVALGAVVLRVALSLSTGIGIPRMVMMTRRLVHCRSICRSRSSSCW